MRTLRPVLFALCTATLFLAGCNTYQKRAAEKSAVYNTLDADTRTRLEARSIQMGDTADMVYIALGTPDEKREIIDASGKATTWIYNNYWREYQGSRLVSYRRTVVYDEAVKSYRVVEQPDYQPVYESRSEERVRITFKNAVVTVIDQSLRN
ncbi:hypothetical protein IMCC26134_00730 [Verrucomicrobia bacterium IMCC26134]|jgi:outer membrane protein assembly factor BamE (lipoprotein component of BamABCDE complex)|nr:hypothetical protein IMCC26134_00730 [Verrucomicrobia bacterium IMCC26134]